MKSIPDVPTSQFVGLKAKKLDGRKARRKNYKVETLPPRKAKGRDPKRHFAVPMRGERQLIRGDKLMTHPDTIWLQAGVR
jgi:hypothetical protein